MLHLYNKIYIVETLVLVYCCFFLLPIVAQRSCAEILEDEEGPDVGEFACQVIAGRCTIDEEEASQCLQQGGECWDDGFCCPQGWKACGAGFATISACYDPTVVTCCGLFSSPGGTAPVLCDAPLRPDRENACVRAGFNRPSCMSIVPPPIESQPTQCLGTPFNPETHVCLGGSFLCPRSAHLACDESCFDPSAYQCNGELRFNQTEVGYTGTSTFLTQVWGLCPIGAPYRCGSAGCYNREQYVCYPASRADQRIDALCPIEAPLLCGSSCYSEELYSCVNDQLELNIDNE